MNLDSKVWGPHYWFVLYSIAITYPNTPNNITKKKYYEFIQNLPLFLPHDEISNYFSNMLTKYPVTPYLDSRDSFTRWIHFIHNRINVVLNKPEITLRFGCPITPKELFIRVNSNHSNKFDVN